MLSVPRSVAWLNGLLLVLLLASCAKQEEAQPTAGVLEATILPAGAALMAVARAADGRVYQVVPDTATGRFLFANLPAGSYLLTFTTIPTYLPPGRLVPLTIAAGQTTRPALDPLDRSGRVLGTVSWVFDGVRYETTQLMHSKVAEYGGIWLHPFHPFLIGPAVRRNIILSIPGSDWDVFKGAGTYQLGVQYGSNPRALCRAAYREDNPDGSFKSYDSFSEQPVAPANSLGTITVIRFDEQSRRFTGTFAFTLPRTDGQVPGPASVVISQGRFDLSF